MYLEALIALDERQEKSIAEKNLASKELETKDKESRKFISNVISYLESQYGKTNPDLQRYGIARRQTVRKKTNPVK